MNEKILTFKHATIFLTCIDSHLQTDSKLLQIKLLCFYFYHIFFPHCLPTSILNIS